MTRTDPDPAFAAHALASAVNPDAGAHAVSTEPRHVAAARTATRLS